MSSPYRIDLPNEIIRDIASRLHPGDIKSFSNSPRRFYNLSKDVLDQHRSRKIAYREINDNDPLAIPHIPDNPELVWYIRRIVIYHRRSTYRNWQDDARGVHDDDLKYQGFHNYEKMERIQRIIDESPYLAKVDAEKWLKEISLGDDKALKMLLLSLTPNLESLVVTRHENWSIGFLESLSEEIRRSALTPNRSEPHMLAIYPKFG